jgi:proteasome lid subunit RPN8/RPN11
MYTILGMLDSLRTTDQEFLDRLEVLESYLPGRLGRPAPPEARLLCAAGIKERVARLYLVSALLGDIASWGNGQEPDLFREAGLTSGRSKAIGLLLHADGYAYCINVPGIEGVVRIQVTQQQFSRFFLDLLQLVESLSNDRHAIPEVGFLNLLYDGENTLFSNFSYLAQRLKQPKFSKLLRDSIQWYIESRLPAFRTQSIPTDYSKVYLDKSVLSRLQSKCASGNAVHGGLLTGSYDYHSQSLFIDDFYQVPTSPSKHFTYDWDAYHRLKREISPKALVVGEWHSHEETTELTSADLRKMRQLRRGDWLVVTPNAFCFYAWRGTNDNKPIVRNLEVSTMKEDDITMDTLGSIPIESFAEKFKSRILGNADDQAIFQGDGNYPPSDSYVAGTLFPASEAQQNLFTTKSTPNSLTVRFWTDTRPEKVIATASFWLYVRYQKGSFNAVTNFVDFYNERTVLTPWDSAMQWPPSISKAVERRLEKAFLKQGKSYLRKRFVKRIEFPTEGKGETVQKLDFEAYREAMRKRGEDLNLSFMASKWVGQVRAEARKWDGRWEITLTLENLYEGKKGVTDPVFYDVRLDCEVEGTEILSQEGKKLGLSTTDEIYALAYNATLEEESASHIRSTQIGQVRRLRKVPVERPICPSFKEMTENPQKALTDFLARLTKNGVSEEFQKEAEQGVSFLLKDSNALEAFRLVNIVFARSPNLEGGVWRFHQLVAFLQCMRLYFQQFLQGASRITPLALNVPTAGGKTEAFTAFAMWAATYGRLEGFPTRDYSIVKYPTTLLASDQLQRAATYIMLLDEELRELGLAECGIGIMMGRKEEKTDDILELSQRVWDQLNACPYCGARWEGSALQKGFAVSTCMNGHRLNLALPEWTFHALPGLILSTVDKLAAKSYGSDMTHLMGAETKLCPVHGYHLGDKCWEFKCKRPLTGPARRARCVFIVLDEAHLLAEDRGTLDSHYETAFTELVSRITGHHPLFMISTATIRGVEHHLQHLGFLRPDEQPILIPPSEDRDKFFAPTDQTHHMVLAVTPRKRAITFALPSIIDHYFDTLVLDFGVKRKSIPRTNLGKLILFFTSYRNLYDTREEYNRSRSYGYIKGKIKEISRDAINLSLDYLEHINLATTSSGSKRTMCPYVVSVRNGMT